jgi:hypothetical protein
MRTMPLSCLLLFWLGCAHVTLQAPSPEAPLEERQAAYEKQKSQDQNIRALTLADGEKVYHIDDLLPALPPDSAAAKSAKKSQKLFIPGTITTAVALGVGVTAAAFFVGGGIKLQEGAKADNEAIIDEGVKKLLIGVGFGIALFPAGIAARHYGGGWYKTRKDAFHRYDEALKKQLELCEVDGGLGQCPAP